MLVNTTEQNSAELDNEHANNCAGDILSLSITDESQSYPVITPQSSILSPIITGQYKYSLLVSGKLY